MDSRPERVPLDAAWKRLAASVVRKSVADMSSPKSEQALDAIMCVLDDGLGPWLELLEMPVVDGVDFVLSGRARQLCGRSHQ